jgi:hypothetical protein
LDIRINFLNDRYTEVRDRLSGKSKGELMALAEVLAMRYQLPEMDRIERRTIDGIIVWFARWDALGCQEREANAMRELAAQAAEAIRAARAIQTFEGWWSRWIDGVGQPPNNLYPASWGGNPYRTVRDEIDAFESSWGF